MDKISRNEEVAKRVDLKARGELMNEGILSKEFRSMIGPVPGVEVDDKFEYRVELVIVGLHGMLEHGIDHTYKDEETNEKEQVATCIVAIDGGLNEMSDPNVLIYVGEGGTSRHNKAGVVSDQKMKGGNSALKNNIKMKTPVRVVKGYQKSVYHRVRKCMVKKMEYKYDGLYKVEPWRITRRRWGHKEI